MTTKSRNLTYRRIHSIRRVVERLDRQIAMMQAQDKRLSKYRIRTFIVGLALIFLPMPTIKWVLACGVGILFVYWVVRHHQLHLRMKCYRIWRHIKKTNLARVKVKWIDIPTASVLETKDGGVLEKDLNLVGERSIHHLIDISISELGSRRLAAWLTCREPDIDTSRRRQGMVRELAELSHFRERLLLNFHLVSKNRMDSEKMTQWLNVPFPQWNIPAAILISILLLVLTSGLFVISDILPIPSLWMIAYGLYLVLFFSGVSRLTPILNAAQWLDDELSVFKRVLLFLEEYPLGNSSQLSKILRPFKTPGKKPTRKMRSLKLVAACIGLRNNPIMTFLLNMLFPWDLLCAKWTLRQREKLKIDFPQWLDALSKLEALNSLANYAYINPGYCYPNFSDSFSHPSTVFNAKALGHPLIDPESNVLNDFAIEKIGDITLITGSNMAGKSTFLKTVGLNLVIAYCGGPVCASSFNTCFFKIRTCIKVDDSLADGVSSFYAEVKQLRRILEQINESKQMPVIYFIDEILRGTNNRERLIGSTALVRSLLQTDSVGLISTHDLELTSLSDEYQSISNYHFAETIRDDQMLFFYKLRRGPCPTTNALHIMRNEGLPIPP